MSDIFSLIANDVASTPAFSAGQTYGTPARILDNLRQVESSGDPNAVNPTTGATGQYQFTPGTLSMLQNQGVHFDPHDPVASRSAADLYIQQLAKQNGGDYAKALAAYGGFKNKDPSSYVSKVMSGMPAPVSDSPFAAIAADNAPVAVQPTAQQPSASSAAQDRADHPLHTMMDAFGGLLEVPAHYASAGVGQIAGGLAGLGTLATGGSVDDAARNVGKVSNALTIQPQTNAGKAAIGAIDKPLGLIPAAGNYAGGKVADLTGSPLGGALVSTAIQAVPMALGAKYAAREQVAAAPDVDAEAGSMGAAGASPQALVANSSPELQAAVANAIKTGPINAKALQNHIDADSLPVPMRLTAGQATGNIHLISQEQNARANTPALADAFDAQNKQLAANMAAFRDNAAPDVFDTNHVESGQGLIDSYLTKDQGLNDDINAKYQALRDANGGDFPVDAGKLYDDISGAFKKNLNSAKLTDGPVGAQVKEIQGLADSGSMSMEQYLALRKNLGDIARTASDGTDRSMASLAIQKLEDLPLQGGAADLKPLADAARDAARNRFQLIDSDPAYKAAVNGSVPPDNFIDKFVVRSPVGDVQTMRSNLSDDPLAQQRMAAGAVNWLSSKSGLTNGEGNFSQAGYNKAYQAIAPKIGDLTGIETAKGLETLGNVARATQVQPRGSYVNNSNTLTANVKDYAGKTVAGAVDYAAHGIPIGNMIRNALTNRAKQKSINQSLAPGAGINMLTTPN